MLIIGITIWHRFWGLAFVNFSAIAADDNSYIMGDDGNYLDTF